MAMASQPGPVAVPIAPAAAPPPPASKQRVAMPLHVQKLQNALCLDRFIDQVEQAFNISLQKNQQLENLKGASAKGPRVYNFTHVTEERQWVKDLLLSPSDSGSELSETEQLQIMLELQYKRRKKWQKRLSKEKKLMRYKYFSAGLLSSNDQYPNHIKSLEEKGLRLKKDGTTVKAMEDYRQRLWTFIVKKEIPKMAKQFNTARHNAIITHKKVAFLCQREVKKSAVKSQRASKDVSSVQPRARRLMKEALVYWRRYEKVEREQRKRAEKEAMEQRKRDDEMREAKRQQRKLNFLITQTELYAHFIGKKLTGEADRSDKILRKLEDAPLQREIQPGIVVNLEAPEEYDSEAIKARVLANVQSAFQKQQQTHNVYKDLARHGVTKSTAGGAAAPGGGAAAPGGGAAAPGPPGHSDVDLQESFDKNFSLATPMLQSDRELPQPSMFNGLLKVYQLKGMNWLANLYDQGINGILADEMGLGKTVQSVAFMAHLAENQGIWGPFLIVSPASTLHNWQQECTRFVPRFKTLPYWGNPQERKIIRKYWNQKLLYKENAPFHVLITSYQLVVQDVKYFQRVKWQYMILDEAQAIKSSTSMRWKVLLSFNCRNRLLLTGTPIQNTMQELWALLHFIMPSMFDSHEEFNEWFSRDIESHAEKKSVMDEHQLSRLHLILKPFMLRRIKRDVEHEMAEKIEVHLSCALSTRQRKLYQALRQRISIDDLLQSSLAPTNRDTSTSHLLNLVMQFRKVCNHPDLFERRNVISPVCFSFAGYRMPSLVYHTPFTPTHRVTTLGIHSTAYIHNSTFPDSEKSQGCWTFLHMVDWSSQEASLFMFGDIVQRFSLLFGFMRTVHLLYQQRLWEADLPASRCSRTQLLLFPSFKLSPPSVASSPLLRGLVFASHTHSGYAHVSHRVYPLQTSAHTSAELTRISSTVDKEQEAVEGAGEGTVQASAPQLPTSEYTCWTEIPLFLVAYIPKVHTPWELPYCCDRSAEHHRLSWQRNGGPSSLKAVLFHSSLPPHHQSNPMQLQHQRSLLQHHKSLPPSSRWPQQQNSARGHHKYQTNVGDLFQTPGHLGPPHGWSHIKIPDKGSMIFDSGKMIVLDKLLVQLKQEDHRVLIYSQMTRVIDLLEEFMGYRRYRFIRLDGSSKISDRRDMVADFQSNAEIFVFLLSTRAGGLGINLTAADTVIFYDSDWNPTVDQQAMDRAHRLGQTKQVTVYRLIVKGTIEEKILQRAREKSEIQKMVISGGDFKPEALKAKEMVSLLLDDDEMETRFLAKQAEKKAILEKIEQGKRTKNNRKRPHACNGSSEPLLKRPKSSAKGDHLVSNSPSPAPMAAAWNSSRPGSVLSLASTGETMNGGELLPILDPQGPGSTDGSSEGNTEVTTMAAGGAGSTPTAGRKLTLSQVDMAGAGENRKLKRTSAPLGGRGKMQKSGKKVGGVSRSAAAASAGAIAGAKAATNAALAAYGLPMTPHLVSPSPGGSSAGVSGSTHSSPRVSPVPMAFVATSLLATPPSNKLSSKVQSSLTYTQK